MLDDRLLVVLRYLLYQRESDMVALPGCCLQRHLLDESAAEGLFISGFLEEAGQNAVD